MNNPTISYTPHGCPWIDVSTQDETKSISVDVGNLHYDEDGGVYLLAFQGETELRLYLG